MCKYFAYNDLDIEGKLGLLSLYEEGSRGTWTGIHIGRVTFKRIKNLVYNVGAVISRIKNISF